MKKITFKRIAVVSAVLMSVFLELSCGKKNENQTVDQTTEESKEPKVEIIIEKTTEANNSSDFIYETTVDSTGVVIQSYIGSRGNVIIPEAIEGFAVKEIGKKAFEAVKNVKSVVLPSSVVKINSEAFRDCSIEEITLNEGLQTIGANAFRNSKLKEVALPSTFEKFEGANQFLNTPLTKVTFSNNVTSIPSSCFAETKLTSVELPDTITSISGYAFATCKISKFNIPSSVKSIGEYAFGGNPLVEVAIAARESSITYGWNTFSDCNSWGTMTVALRRDINKSGYKGTYYFTDVSKCKEPSTK